MRGFAFVLERDYGAGIYKQCINVVVADLNALYNQSDIGSRVL